MEKKYGSLGTAGTHRGEVDAEDLGQSVRAPHAEDVNATGRPVGRAYVHERNEKEGWHRFRAHGEGSLPQPSEGSTEMGRYTSLAEIEGALKEQRSRHRWVVLENTRTGEVSYHEEMQVVGDLTADGQFDQATLFDTQESAAAYADRVRKKAGR